MARFERLSSYLQACHVSDDPDAMYSGAQKSSDTHAYTLIINFTETLKPQSHVLGLQKDGARAVCKLNILALP